MAGMQLPAEHRFSLSGLDLLLRPLANEADLDEMYALCLGVGWTFVQRHTLTEILGLFKSSIWGAFNKDNKLICKMLSACNCEL